MRVCVLYDDETWGFTPAEFIAHYPCEWEMLTLSRPVFDKLKAIEEQNRFDVYFNLCDGAADEDYPGLDVVQAMEELNMPFTGSDFKLLRSVTRKNASRCRSLWSWICKRLSRHRRR